MARFKNVDRDTPMLLPADMREWVPENDLVHFVLEAVEAVPLAEFKVNDRGSGSAEYPPRMMLALLIYSYANGLFASRRIERATYRDLAVRYLTGNTHPDHDTICAFRKKNFQAVSRAFLEVLKLAREMKVLKVGTISVDGTHLRANASKRRSIRYDRACKLEKQLELDIAELMRKAEQADSNKEEDNQRLPTDIAKREALLKRMQKARKRLEERAVQRAEVENEAHKEKLKKREKRRPSRRGPMPRPPSSKPKARDQTNLTDDDSRLMRKNNSSSFEQSYNAHAAVDADGSQLILSSLVANTPGDAPELRPVVESISTEIGLPTSVLADSGYVNIDNLKALQAKGIEPHVPPSRNCAHQMRQYDFRPPPKTLCKPVTDPYLQEMRDKLATDAGRALYAKRKQTVEPVFGIVKQAMGFRQFLLRGLPKVNAEWELVCLAYNVKRLFNLREA
jgi:transposase